MLKVKRNLLKQYDLIKYKNFISNKNNVFFSVGQTIAITYFDIYEDEITKRNFTGVCVSINRKINNSSFVLRFIYKNDVVDQRFFFNSPIICNISVVSFLKKVKRSKYKLYHL